MGKRLRRQGETFADVVARVTSNPSRGRSVPEGLRANVWGDRSGRAFTLVADDLAPVDAQALALDGAQVVHDVCGCGGADCRLDWLGPDEIAATAASGLPVLHPSKDGRADLEHWRSADGQDLVVVAVEASWGSRIGPGR